MLLLKDLKVLSTEQVIQKLLFQHQRHLLVISITSFWFTKSHDGKIDLWWDIFIVPLSKPKIMIISMIDMMATQVIMATNDESRWQEIISMKRFEMKSLSCHSLSVTRQMVVQVRHEKYHHYHLIISSLNKLKNK